MDIETPEEFARSIEKTIVHQYQQAPNGRGGLMIISKDYIPAGKLIAARDALIRSDERRKAAGWISVKERLPESGKFVFAHFICKNQVGKYSTTIRAFYAAPKDIEQSDSDEDSFAEYDEIADTYYLPKGWYECNEEEEIHWFVHADITHWMPLPEPPAIMAEPEEAKK